MWKNKVDRQDSEKAYHPGPPNGKAGYKPITLTDFLLYVRKEDSIPESLKADIQHTAAVFREKYLARDELERV